MNQVAEIFSNVSLARS